MNEEKMAQAANVMVIYQIMEEAEPGISTERLLAQLADHFKTDVGEIAELLELGTSLDDAHEELPSEFGGKLAKFETQPPNDNNEL